MEEQMILIKSREQDTGIVYTFLIGQKDAERIVENEGKAHLKIAKGYIGFKSDTIEIMQPTGHAFLLKEDVLDQLNEQL